MKCKEFTCMAAGASGSSAEVRSVAMRLLTVVQAPGSSQGTCSWSWQCHTGKAACL